MSPMNNNLVFIGLVALISYVAYATDPNQLQDFCVGINDPDAAGNILSLSTRVLSRSKI